MKIKAMTLPMGFLLLGACAAEIAAPVAQMPSPDQQMLDSVFAMAGPNQNVQTARLRSDDNCYWYSHVGPVETTELPLLTAEGRHICGPTEAETPVEPTA